jgi:hypothetical protein
VAASDQVTAINRTRTVIVSVEQHPAAGTTLERVNGGLSGSRA